jgi:uncharacterized protein DUF1571
MLAGKVVFRPALVLAAGLVCCGCQLSPDPRLASRTPPPAPVPDRQQNGWVRAAAPLRITEPPAAVAQAPAPSSEDRPGTRALPTSAPSPTLPALPNSGITPVAATAPAVPGESDLRRLYRLAAEKYAGMDGYYVCLTRREQVNGKDQPKEVIRLMFRKEPWSVRLVWLEGQAKGREVVYVKGRYEGKLHTRLGPNDGNLLYRAGSHIALAPDSALVTSSSRHSVTEAGIGNIIDHFGAHVVANEKGDTRLGTLTYRGREKRPEFSEPVETVEQTIPAGAEKELPRGGRRLWFFDDAANKIRNLPALVVTTDITGHEVEYYRYDKYVAPIRFDDRDFDPNALWGKP